MQIITGLNAMINWAIIKLLKKHIRKSLHPIQNMGNVIKEQMVQNVKKTTSPQQFVEYVNTNLADANPSSYLYDYAIELHKDGKIDNAIYMYQQAIKSNGSNPEMYVNLAPCTSSRKRF